jgi:hypothetical protein
VLGLTTIRFGLSLAIALLTIIVLAIAYRLVIA